MLYVMLVGAYPFERPEDKHDSQKLQKMIQRILHVDYAFPPHVRASPDLRWDGLAGWRGARGCLLGRVAEELGRARKRRALGPAG
jgi:hypothetical protein